MSDFDGGINNYDLGNDDDSGHRRPDGSGGMLRTALIVAGILVLGIVALSLI